MDLKTVSLSLSSTDLSKILRKFFIEVKTEKGQALTPSVLTGTRAAINRHLTCATHALSRSALHLARQRIHICQQNVWSEGQAIYETMRSYIQAGDMHKLNRYFMEGQNTVGVWKNAERLVEIIAFLCVFILLVVVERDGGSLQGSHLEKRKQKTDDTGARYVRTIWPCVLIIIKNQMTFVGHIVYLCPSQHHLHSRSARAQIMLLGPQVNYIPPKVMWLSYCATSARWIWDDR